MVLEHLFFYVFSDLLPGGPAGPGGLLPQQACAVRVALSVGFWPQDRRNAELSAFQAVSEQAEDPHLPVRLQVLQPGPRLPPPLCLPRPGPWSHSPFSPCKQDWFSMVSEFPVLLPQHEMLPFLPLLLVCSSQTLPVPQIMAVSCCTGPRCPESCGVEPCLHAWNKESEMSVTVRPEEKCLACCLPQKSGH